MNRNLFLWMEIFVCTTDLYNTTADRWSCRLPNRNVCNASASSGGRTFCIQISREWSYSLPIYSYHSKGNLIALQLCRWQFSYSETLHQTFCPLLSKLSERRQILNLGIWSPFLQRAQCSHCNRCTSYGKSVRLSVCLSVCRSVHHTPVLCQNDGT